MKDKYLTLRVLDLERDNDFVLPIPLCCGIVKPCGDVIIPEQVRE